MTLPKGIRDWETFDGTTKPLKSLSNGPLPLPSHLPPPTPNPTSRFWAWRNINSLLLSLVAENVFMGGDARAEGSAEGRWERLPGDLPSQCDELIGPTVMTSKGV